MRVLFPIVLVLVVAVSFSPATLARAVFSPNGDTIASVSASHEILLLQNAVTWEQIVIGQHDALVNSITFSPDGQRLLSASDDGTAKVWDMASGELVLTLSMSDPVKDARFAANGQRILTRSSGGSLGLYHSNDGEVVKPLTDYLSVIDADISADGSRIVVTHADGSVSVWDDYLATHDEVTRLMTVAPRAMQPGGWVPATVDKQGLLAGWVSSWIEQNLEDYFSYYAQRYTPRAGMTHEQWRSQRSQRISRPANISITVSDVQTRELAGGQIEMKFQQRYQSEDFSDFCLKQIVWAGSSVGHRIVSEQTLSCR